MAVSAKPSSEAKPGFRTLSGEPVRELYTREDLPAGIGGPEDPIGRPGSYPFTRGIHESMYRGRLWTMRQFAGFGTSEETNERFHYLLEHGQTGLSTAFDMPSLMGHDSDHRARAGRGRPRGRGRSTRSTTCRRSSRGIDLGEVSVSMTINAPAAIMLAFYVAAAEIRPPAHPDAARAPLAGRSRRTSSRSTSPRRSGASRSTPRCACAADMIEWCTRRHAPLAPDLDLRLPHPRGRLHRPAGARLHAQGRPHLRRAGASPAASTSTTSRPRLSFFFNAQIDFFEEIAKYRAARRIWARELRETLRRQEPALLADALPRPDRRRQPDRAAAAQQHRAHHHRGPRGRARGARSRCTPTPTTRRSRCPPRRPSRSRCAPSR